MKLRRWILLWLACLTAALSRAATDSGEGTSAAALLTLPVGARSAGMGGVLAAVDEDASAIHGNPAALALLKRQQAATSYLDGLLDLKTEFLGYAVPLPESLSAKPSAVAVSVLASQLGSLEVLRTNPDGSFLDERTISAGSDLILSGAWGSQLKDSALPLPTESQEHYIGLSARYLRSTLAEQYSASAFSSDFGYLTRSASSGMRGAFLVSNVGTPMKFKQQADPLPLTYRVGLAWQKPIPALGADHLTFGADFLLDREKRTLARAGVEHRFKHLALRAGYQGGRGAGRWTGGFGARVPLQSSQITLDYAFLPLGPLGLTHSLSLSLTFGRARDESVR